MANSVVESARPAGRGGIGTTNRVHRSGSEVGRFPARKAGYVDPMVVVRFELAGVCALDSRVIGAHVRGKLFVALQLEVAHHFVERCAGE
jgi:hypothetical protein